MQKKIDLCAPHLFKLNNPFRNVWSRSGRQLQRITMETCRVNLQRRSLFVQMRKFSNNPNHPFKNAMDHPKIILEDLDRVISNVNQQNVDESIQKCTQSFKKILQLLNLSQIEYVEVPNILNKISEIMTKARSSPTLETCICKIMRECEGLSYLISNCDSNNDAVKFSSAKLLGQCLTSPENRAYVVEHGLEKVVRGVCGTTKNRFSVEQSRIRTGILEHLFKHSENTCEEITRYGGLEAIIEDCRSNDVEILRNCAKALTNFSLYHRGREIQEAIIHHKVTLWLFPLAFHDDDIVKYYACLATSILAADKELLANVLRSGTLKLVKSFSTNRDPCEFIVSNRSHILSQSKNWLSRLIPVLNSLRAEAVDLAAFHFLLEASIGELQENIQVFQEIGAMEILKKIAAGPSIASKFAAQTLKLFGEKTPAKLIKQVPLWSAQQVQQWVSHIGFSQYLKNFREVDGDLLLTKVNEETLKEDFEIKSRMHRLRFLRELQNLKKIADYGNHDQDGLKDFLRRINPEFTKYTYDMLSAGVTKTSIRSISASQLREDCGISNTIHVSQIMNAIKAKLDLEEQNPSKLDVFISYRRAGGSNLASLLKCLLSSLEYSVFLDVDDLKSGKFDVNLLQKIEQSKNFVLVLTPQSLDRCIGDDGCEDWVHREIVAAKQYKCNIIPIIDAEFLWPKTDELPEDMRDVCCFNAIQWNHLNQKGVVEKLQTFLR